MRCDPSSSRVRCDMAWQWDDGGDKKGALRGVARIQAHSLRQRLRLERALRIADPIDRSPVRALLHTCVK
jgi:hypothetical protein